MINRLELPNQQEITYEYGWWVWWGGWLKAVNLPDGSKSTWTTTPFASGLMKITQSDSSASGKEQKKNIYITHHWANSPEGKWVRQPPHLIRRVGNGANEVKYANNLARDANNKEVLFIHSGGNKIHKTSFSRTGGATGSALIRKKDLAKDFYGTSALLKAPIAAQSSEVYDSRAQSTGSKDALGRQSILVRNPLTNSILVATGVDNAKRTATYNHFNQPLTATDSLGRTSAYAYDSFGNKISYTQALGSDDETTIKYLYNAKGQIIEARDPLYDSNVPELHNTQFKYNDQGYLVEKIEAADTAGNARPSSKFTYDHITRQNFQARDLILSIRETCLFYERYVEDY